MNTLIRKSIVAALAWMLTTLTTTAWAQEAAQLTGEQPATEEAPAKQRRSPFEVSRVSLASLPEVQAELKLNEEQKDLAKTLQADLIERVREVFQSGGGDFDAMRVEIEKISNENSAKIMEKLDDGQKKRLTEIYVQANGPNALGDKEVMEVLKITDEQKEELETAREDNRYAFMETWGELQGMSEEDRRETLAELREEADDNLLEELTEEQRTHFGTLGGAELDYDLTPLQWRRGD